MKLLLLFTFTLFSSIYVYSQSNSGIIGRYYWSEAVVIERVSSLDGKSSGELLLSIRGQRFEVVKEVGDTNAIIRVLNYDTTSEKHAVFNLGHIDDKESLVPMINHQGDSIAVGDSLVRPFSQSNARRTQVYFLVDKDLVRDYAVKYTYNGLALAVGAINYPFKLRVQKNNFDFSGSFNLGAALGVEMPRYSFRSFHHTVLIGFSVSNIKLDSVDVSMNHEKLTESNDFSAFSASFGYMIQYQKAQVGLFFGVDYLTSTNQKSFDWDYQGQPWISIGIGFNIFTQENEKSKDPGN